MPAKNAAVDPAARGPAQRAKRGRPVIFKVHHLKHVGLPCPYCRNPMKERGTFMVTRDHMLSRRSARKLPPEFRKKVQRVNILMCCEGCNNAKDELTLVQFLAWQPIGSVRAVGIAALIEDLRAKHPQDVFEALTGSPP